MSKHKEWIALVCNRSGSMKAEMNAELAARNVTHVDVWSIDTQDPKNPNETFHKKGHTCPWHK
jgi:hypothetical protein